MDDLQVLLLIVTADIVGFKQPSLFLNHIYGLRVILYIQPVAHIPAVPVHRKLPALKRVVDHQRDQLLRDW